MELFKIMLGNKKAEFSIIGIANVNNKTVKFQALMNGIPFTESNNYEHIRNRIFKAIEINQNKNNLN